MLNKTNTNLKRILTYWDYRKFEKVKIRILESYKSQEEKLTQVKTVVQDCRFQTSSLQASIKNVEKRLKEETNTYEGCQKHLNNYQEDYSEVKRLKETNNATLANLKVKVAENNELITKLRDEQNDIKSRLPVAKEQVDSVQNELNNLRKSERKQYMSILFRK